MHSRFVIGAVAAGSLVFLACGGSSTGGGSGCRITLSGEVSGSYDCAAPATFSWHSGGEAGVFNLVTEAQDAPRTGVLATTLQIRVPAPPEMKTYQAIDTGVGANLFLAKDMDHTWGAQLGMFGNTGGPASFTFTSIDAATDEAGDVHPVHGTLHATLVHYAGSSSTGDVVVDVIF